MKKHWWIALVLVFALAIPAAASQAIKIYVNGTQMVTDVPAQIINGRTMVPVRAIAEYFGKTVAWDSASNTVNIVGLTTLDIAGAITAEWAEGGHGDQEQEVLGHAGPNDSCQPCHSGQGLGRELTDNPYRPTATQKATGAAEIEFPQLISCGTCHGTVGQQMIDTGVVPAKLARFSATDLTLPGAALCTACHNGRRDTADLYNKAVAGNIDAGAYPHNANAALYSGKGGMQYPGVTYASSATHQTLGCVGCHMPKTAEGYRSHEFTMQESNIAVCQKCHATAKNFDDITASIEKELTAKLAQVQELAVAKVPGAVRIATSRTEFPFADKDGKKVDVKLIPLDAYVAAYNYYMINDELQNFGHGAHNPQYERALLDESIKRLK